MVVINSGQIYCFEFRELNGSYKPLLLSILKNFWVMYTLWRHLSNVWLRKLEVVLGPSIILIVGGNKLLP